MEAIVGKRFNQMDKRFDRVEVRVKKIGSDVVLLKRFRTEAKERFTELSRFKSHVYVMVGDLAESFEKIQSHTMRIQYMMGRYHALS